MASVAAPFAEQGRRHVGLHVPSHEEIWIYEVHLLCPIGRIHAFVPHDIHFAHFFSYFVVASMIHRASQSFHEGCGLLKLGRCSSYPVMQVVFLVVLVAHIIYDRFLENCLS